MLYNAGFIMSVVATEMECCSTHPNNPLFLLLAQPWFECITQDVRIGDEIIDKYPTNGETEPYWVEPYNLITKQVNANNKCPKVRCE